MNGTDNMETKIIATAKALFTRQGYDRTSMSEIAASAGINRPALHYYFHTKEMMFQAVFTSLISLFMPRIEDIALDEHPLEEKIERITDAFFSIYIANPYLPRFILGEIERDPDRLLAMMENLGFDRYLAVLSAMIDRERETGRIRELPNEIIFMTFFSQMTFPFVTRALITRILMDENDFQNFLPIWKRNVISQMKALLFGRE